MTPLATCLPDLGRQAAYPASPSASSTAVLELEEEPAVRICPQCHAARYVHPRERGVINWKTIVPCSMCSSPYGASKNRALDEAGIPQARRDSTFESFVPVEGAAEALGLAQLLATGQADFKLLLIYGRRGSGKSHLAYAAGLASIERGLSVRFEQVGSLMTKLRRTMSASRHNGPSSDDIVEDLKKCDFLILDDLGSEQGTAWDQNILEVLINYRYAEEKETLVTTHRDQSEVNAYIFSRFTDARISRRVLNSATDYRPRKDKTSAA